MEYKITLTHRYPDAYSGTLEIYENEKIRYKCNVVILKALVEKIRTKGCSYNIVYKDDPMKLIPLCPTIAVGRTRVSLIPVQGRSKHDHHATHVYLVSNNKKYQYEGNICNMSKMFFDKTSTFSISENIESETEEPYFISKDGVIKESEFDDADYCFDDGDFVW